MHRCYSASMCPKCKPMDWGVKACPECNGCGLVKSYFDRNGKPCGPGHFGCCASIGLFDARCFFCKANDVLADSFGGIVPAHEIEDCSHQMPAYARVFVAGRIITLNEKHIAHCYYVSRDRADFGRLSLAMALSLLTASPEVPA